MGIENKDTKIAVLKQELEWQEEREKDRKKFRMEMLQWLGLFAISFIIGFYFKFDPFAWTFGW